MVALEWSVEAAVRALRSTPGWSEVPHTQDSRQKTLAIACVLRPMSGVSRSRAEHVRTAVQHSRFSVHYT